MMGSRTALQRSRIWVFTHCITAALTAAGSVHPAVPPGPARVPYHSVQLCGGYGNEGAKFYSAFDFRACPDGGVLLLTAEERLLRFDRSGRLILELKLANDPVFHKPLAVAPTPDGGFVLADYTHGYALLRYDKTGRFSGDFFRVPPSAKTDRTFTEMAVSRDGVVFLWDGEAPEVHRVRLDGTVLPPVVLAPAPAGKEDAPTHLLLTSNAIILVGDGAAHRYTLAGAFQRRIPLPRPTRAAACDAAGGLAVLRGGDDAHEIVRVAPDGRVLARWGVMGERQGELLFVEHLAMGPNGMIFTQERSLALVTTPQLQARIQYWSPGAPAPEPRLSVRRSDQPQRGSPRVAWRITSIPGRSLGQVSAPAVDGDGRVYLGENHWFWRPVSGGGGASHVETTHFLCFHREGRLLRTFGAGRLHRSITHTFGAVALDRQRGHLFSVNAGERSIRTFRTDGAEIGAIPLPAAFLGGDEYTARPIDLAIGPGGVLLFPDDNRHRIWFRDPREQQWRSFGAWGTGPRDFHMPTAVTAAPDGSLYVADRMNFRVSKFDAHQRYLFEIRHRGGTTEKYYQWPQDVEATNDGGVVVLYDFCIARFNREGRMVWHWESPGGKPLTSTGSGSGGNRSPGWPDKARL